MREDADATSNRASASRSRSAACTTRSVGLLAGCTFAPVEPLIRHSLRFGCHDLRAKRPQIAGHIRTNQLVGASHGVEQRTAATTALVAYKRRLLDLGAALHQDTMDRERTRALLANILGPVVLRRDSEGGRAEMEEPAQRLALAGSTLLTVIARARNVRRKLIRPSDR
jgi:hypothetical protein